MIANTIIKSVFRKAFIKDGSFTPSTQQFADGLERLNDMVNTWSAHNDLVYENTREELTIPSGTLEITIGATGTLVTGRPLKIRVASIKDNDIEYPLTIIDERQYQTYVFKISTARPYKLYYRNTWPDGTIYFEYTTDQSYTLILTSLKQLSTFPDGETDVSLPDYYEKALKDNLFIEMADELGVGNRITSALITLADNSRGAVIGQSIDIVPSRSDIGVTGTKYNIYSDWY